MPITLSFPSTDRSETGRAYGRGRRADFNARRTSPEVGVPVVYRSFATYPKKISAYQHSRIQPTRVPTFRGNFSDAATGSDYRIQKSRTRIDPRWRWRDFGRSGAQKNFALEDQQRPVARGHASGARAWLEIERDHDVWSR